VITVFEKRTCSKCCELVALLAARGIEPERIDFHVEGLPEPVLRDVVRKAGVAPRALLRAREAQALGLDDPGLADDELLRRMSEHPEVVQRPIVVAGERAVVARPPERVLELLDRENASPAG
jgi:arsenate reductase (glutaredoxin)